jgi:hypothetical protein
VRTLVLLFDIRIHIPGSYAGEEFYVFVRVELGHLSFCGRFGSLVSALRINRKKAGRGCSRISPFSCISRSSSPANGTYVSGLASSCENQFIARVKATHNTDTYGWPGP